MKKSKSANIKTMLIIIIITMLTRMITFFPWWSFTIPVIIIGVIISNKKGQISFFWIGFVSGFILWAGTNFYFDLQFKGDILTNVGSLLFMPKVAVFIISGLIGGMLTGLAFYTGKILFLPNKMASSETTSLNN